MLRTAKDPVFTEAFGSSPEKTPLKYRNNRHQARQPPSSGSSSDVLVSRFGVARDEQVQAEYDAERASHLRIDMIPAPSLASYAPSSLNSPTNYRQRSSSPKGTPSLARDSFGLSIDTSSMASHMFDDSMQFDGAEWSPKRRDRAATDALQDAGDLPSAVPAALAGSMSPTLLYLSKLARKKNRAGARSNDVERGQRGEEEPIKPVPRSRALDLFHGAAEYVAMSGAATRRLLEAAKGLHARDSFSNELPQDAVSLRQLGQLLPAEVVNPAVKIQRNSFAQPHGSSNSADDTRGNLLADALGAGQRGSRAAPPRSHSDQRRGASQLAKTGGYYDYSEMEIPADYTGAAVVPLLPQDDPLEATLLRGVRQRGAERAASPAVSPASRDAKRTVQFPLTYSESGHDFAVAQPQQDVRVRAKSPEDKYRGRLQRIRPRSARLPPHDPPSQAPAAASAAADRQRPHSAAAGGGRPPWRPAASTRRVADVVHRPGRAPSPVTQQTSSRALAAPRSDSSARRWVDTQRRREEAARAREEAAVQVRAALEAAAAADTAARRPAEAGGDIEGTMYLLSILEDQDGEYEDELRRSGNWSPKSASRGGGSRAPPHAATQERGSGTPAQDDDMWRLRQALHAVQLSPPPAIYHSVSGSIRPHPAAAGQDTAAPPHGSPGQVGEDSDGIDVGNDLRSVNLAHTDSYAADLARAVYSSNMRHAAPNVRPDAPPASRHEGGGRNSRGVGNNMRPSSAASSKNESHEAQGGEGGGTQFLRQRLRHLQRRAVLRTLELHDSESEGDEEGVRKSLPKLHSSRGDHRAPSRVPVPAVQGGARRGGRNKAIAALLRPDRDLAAFVRSADPDAPSASRTRRARPRSAAASPRRPFGVGPEVGGKRPSAPSATERGSMRPASARERRNLRR